MPAYMRDKNNIRNAPDLSGKADDGKEHSVDVEVAEEASNNDAVDSERYLRDAQIQTDADDVSFLQRMLSSTHHPRLSRCHQQ